MRRPHCRRGHSLQRTARPTIAHSGFRTRNAGTTTGSQLSTPIRGQPVWRRSLTCGATSSPAGHGWPPTRRWRRGLRPRTWMSSRRVPGLIRTTRNCLSVEEVNLQALFGRVAAVVHHGGAGTTTAAAKAGTPQVVVPQIYDQHYWAKRVHHLGIGTAHAPGTPTADSLTEALSHTIQPDVAARARAVAASVRTDGPEIAARRLIDKASRSALGNESI